MIPAKSIGFEKYQSKNNEYRNGNKLAASYNPVCFLNSFMAKARRTIPNTFFTMAIPPTPRSFSILLRNLSTKKTMITFKTIAIMMDSKLYSARMESRVVKVPVPAIKGKAKGTTLAVAGTESFEI